MTGMTRLRLRLAAAVAAAAALVLTGCSSSGSSGSADAQTGFILGRHGAPDTAAAGHRKEAPDVSGTTLDNVRAALSDYRGKVVVLNVWGSWCNPCRAEAPMLQQVWDKYKSQDVQFLGINTRDTDPANAVRFEHEKGVTFPSLYDPSGTQILKFPKGTLNPQSIPTTLVIDRDGGIAARAMRALSAEEIEAMLKPVVAEQAAPAGQQ